MVRFDLYPDGIVSITLRYSSSGPPLMDGTGVRFSVVVTLTVSLVQ